MVRGRAWLVLALGGVGCDVEPPVPQPTAQLWVDGVDQPIDQVTATSWIGNARDGYVATVDFAGTGVLELDFAAANAPGTPFPPSAETVTFPVAAPEATPFQVVYGTYTAANGDPPVSLLGGVDGSVEVWGTADRVHVELVDLVFPPSLITTDAYTHISPEVVVVLPELIFPRP